MKKNLGQFMTPPELARLVAAELGECDTVIDFSVGQGALLSAVQRESKKLRSMIGVDVDSALLKDASELLKSADLKLGDGLSASIPDIISGSIGVVGNPPYLAGVPEGVIWIEKAFSGFRGKLGSERTEVQFLARSLVTARANNGRVVFVMPIGFADGDIYRKIRACLMQQYHLKKCIEIPSYSFSDTEARTVVLVIDTLKSSEQSTEICEFDFKARQSTVIFTGYLNPGCRLDARYHRVKQTHELGGPQLKDLNVTIDRGNYSRKESENLNISFVHTSDLAKVQNGHITIAANQVDGQYLKVLVTAKKGDILLSRTGTRVSWEPILVESGEAPITDHVFRIRAPKRVQNLVYRSFRHPKFESWLEAASKGVCATVLTKRELLEMPVFAYAE